MNGIDLRFRTDTWS